MASYDYTKPEDIIEKGLYETKAKKVILNLFSLYRKYCEDQINMKLMNSDENEKALKGLCVYDIYNAYNFIMSRNYKGTTTRKYLQKF